VLGKCGEPVLKYEELEYKHSKRKIGGREKLRTIRYEVWEYQLRRGYYDCVRFKHNIVESFYKIKK
jgi:hypothetical protein